MISPERRRKRHWAAPAHWAQRRALGLRLAVSAGRRAYAPRGSYPGGPCPGAPHRGLAAGQRAPWRVGRSQRRLPNITPRRAQDGTARRAQTKSHEAAGSGGPAARGSRRPARRRGSCGQVDAPAAVSAAAAACGREQKRMRISRAIVTVNTRRYRSMKLKFCPRKRWKL